MAEISIAHNRKITAYPAPKNYALLIGYVSRNNVGISETIDMIIKDFFSQKSPEERLILLKYAQEAMNKPKK